MLLLSFAFSGMDRHSPGFKSGVPESTTYQLGGT